METPPLSESESLVGNILDHIPIGVVHVEISGTISFINRVALKILGIEKNQLEGKHYFNSGLKQINESFEELRNEDLPLSLALKEKKRVKDFVQGIVLENDVVWISAEAAPLYDSDGALIGGVTSFIDISEKILLKKKYREEFVRNKHLIESVQAVFWEWSLATDQMIYVSPKVEDMLGYSVEERSKKGFWETKIHPDDRKWAIDFHRNLVGQGKSHEFEYRFEKNDGTYIWIKDIIDVLVEDGQAVFLRGIMVDITKQKNVSEKLKESEDLYKLLAENTTDLITLHNLDLSYKFISPSIYENLGYDEGEIRDMPHIELYHPDDQNGFKQAYEKVLGGSQTQLQLRLKHKNDSYLWFEGELNPVFDVNNQIIFIKNSTRQIHEKKIAEDQLAESEVRYRSLLIEAPFAISIYNKDGILINTNSAFDETWDVESEDLRGEFNIKEDHPFTTKEPKEVIERAFNGEKGDFILKYETVKGNLKNFQIKFFPLINAAGEIYNVVFVTEDITARNFAEKLATEGEALKQGILNSLDDAILVVDKDGIIISINKRLQNYILRSPYNDVKIGGNVFSFIEFFHEKELVRSGLEKVLNRSASFFDYETKLADDKWYNLKVTQLKKPYGAVISWQNINTRKEIEIALEKSLKKYRNIYNRAPVMMHSINAKGEIMSVSDFWLEKMGYDRKEVIGRKTSDFLAPQSKEGYKKKLKDFFTDGFSRNIPYQFETKNGEIIEVLLSATSEYDDEGNFERSLSGMVDVTELKKTERELMESRQSLLEAHRITKIGNYEISLTDYTFTSSPEVEAMMGVSDEDKDLSILEKLIHPEDLGEFVRKINKTAKTGEDFFHIYRISHLKNHMTRWISGRGKVVKDESGNIVKMIGTVQDISEQKVAEDKIRRLSDRILLATELAEIGVWEYSAENNETYWDNQMYEIFDNVKEPITGFKELSKHMKEEDALQLWELKKKIDDGARFIESDLKMHINGNVKYLRTYNRVIRGSNGQITRVLGVMYDNTSDKTLQLELETSLEEKNILLKEVHHRVKNNMQLVSSILALKSYDLKDVDSKAIFSEINERIKSMAVIHDQLYKFYNVSEINISDYLNHIARELRVLMGSGSKSIEVEADNKLFDVDKVLLFGLIVSELVSNAFKHSFNEKKNGTVTIVFSAEGSINNLQVINDGATIPPSVLEKKSSGLGISLIKTFAKQLNGELELSERNGFRIQFESK